MALDLEKLRKIARDGVPSSQSSTYEASPNSQSMLSAHQPGTVRNASNWKLREEDRMKGLILDSNDKTIVCPNCFWLLWIEKTPTGNAVCKKCGNEWWPYKDRPGANLT